MKEADTNPISTAIEIINEFEGREIAAFAFAALSEEDCFYGQPFAIERRRLRQLMNRELFYVYGLDPSFGQTDWIPWGIID